VQRHAHAHGTRDELDRGEGCEQGSLEDEELAVNRERENHGRLRLVATVTAVSVHNQEGFYFNFFTQKLGDLSGPVLRPWRWQRGQAKLLSHHLEKNKVCIMLPRKNIMQPSLLRSAHALASQHLRTLDAQAMHIQPSNS
jgi:hypothetical protein